MLNEEQIRGKWNEIKGGIRNVWGRITEDDLEKVKGNFSELTGIVEKKYGQTKETIKKDIDKLMSSFDNDSDKSSIDTNQASYERTPDSEYSRPNDLRTAGKSQYQDKVQDIKTKGPERSAFEKEISQKSDQTKH
jgi:uncharacterized protein YjbJ (UPF0337 family)